MKQILVLNFLCFSLYAFSQKNDNGYTLLDFYKDNWAKDTKTNTYYQKQDIDSFKRVTKTFKSRSDNMIGLSEYEIKKIFGDPYKTDNGCANNTTKRSHDYIYHYSNHLGGPNDMTMFVVFDCDSNKVVYFETFCHVIKEW